MSDHRDLLHRLFKDAELLAVISQEMSFTRAAGRLGLQQSAVSHRVRALEEVVGAPLFERTTRRLDLTATGSVLCSAATRSLEVFEAALRELEDLQRSRSLRLSVSSSLAMKWLLPRLAQAEAAGLELVLDVDDAVSDLRSGSAQAAVRFGVGPYPGLHSVRLDTAELIPVARPGFLNAPLSQEMCVPGGCAFLADRRAAADGTEFDWQSYFRARGWQEAEPEIAATFDRTDLVLQAAISGMGVALGRTLLVEDDLAAGFLVEVGERVKSRAGYWLVATSELAQTQGFQALSRWLKSQMKRS
ncbi:LysR substrate-binding domain-containing protein [Roseibium sp.]|uniref:LysR substrate-binding domain-containing protein n=1 Tax=Roseibium sp. TaxID=1936156 RepID=UPI003A96E1BC